jgi:PAN domain
VIQDHFHRRRAGLANFAWLMILTISLAMLLSAASQRASAQTVSSDILRDTIIQGADYDDFQIQGPQAGRACQEACARDPRCKAWTYIKTVGQCRLKHQLGQKVKNGCCVAGYKSVVEPPVGNGQYARQQFCADYANVATAAQDNNLQQGCGLVGPRWTASYRDHYAYCLRTPQDAVETETSLRSDDLARCTQSASTGLEAKCDHYVRATMVQIASAASGGCQVDQRDPRWAPEAQTHARACRIAPNRVLDDAIAERERVLSACFESAGTEQADCTRYATTALTQFQQGLDNACGFSGQRWHASKARHYQFCRSATAQIRNGETQARSADLARCVQQASRTKRCTEYAKAATTQAIRSDNSGCELAGPGARWSIYTDDHVAFCQSASEAALRSEDAGRTRDLNRCQARQQEVNAACDVYAKRSNRLSALNIENDCGNDGDLWTTDYQTHYAYCLGANINERQSILQGKRRDIANCSNDRGFTLRLEF